MSDSSSFYRTSYKISSFNKHMVGDRNNSIQKTQDTEAYFERTGSQFATARYQNITSRSGYSSAFASNRPQKCIHHRETELPIQEATAGRMYSKRKIDPFFLSPVNNGDGFVELSENSLKDASPYRIGTRNFSHGELKPRSSTLTVRNTERNNTEPNNVEITGTLKKMPLHSETKNSQTFKHLEDSKKESDFFVKRIDFKRSGSLATLSQQ